MTGTCHSDRTKLSSGTKLRGHARYTIINDRVGLVE